MESMKKVYSILIILVVVLVGILCGSQLEIIDVTTETGANIVSIATVLFTSSIFFSRNANVVANKKNNGLAWGVTIIVLIYVIIQLLAILIDDFTISAGMNKFITVTMIAVGIILLIFEIPESNSLHGAFQKLIVFIILITCGLGYGYYNKIEKASENFYENFNYSEYLKEMEAAANLAKFFYCGIYISIGALLINPMLRVRYSDDEYSNVEEIDKILTRQTQYQNASIPNPNAVLNQTHQNAVATGQHPQYATPNVAAQTQQPLVDIPTAQPAPAETVTTPQVPTEKVINPNFKHEDIPEAIIPSLDFGDSTPVVEQAPTVTPEATPAPVVEQAPTVTPEATPTPVVEQAPMVTPEATPTPVVEQAPVVAPEATPTPIVEQAPVVAPVSDPTQPNT